MTPARQLVRQISAVGPPEPVVLVAHSMSGPVVSAAAELAPHLIGALVYVAALIPPPGESAASFGMSEENAASLVRSLVVADPQVVRTPRIDPRNPNSEYRRVLRSAFYADVRPQLADSAIRLLTCDDPSGIVSGAYTLTSDRWGAIPRSYIICEQDRAILPAVQQTLVQVMDDMGNGNPTRVFRLASSHSPFFSTPARLARIIESAATPRN